MNKYIKFDVVKYIKEQPDREREREELQQKYDDISLISGGMPSTASSHKISKPTSEVAMKRLAIKERIDEIDHESMAFSHAWEDLSDRQKHVLREFYFSGNSKTVSVEKLSKTYKMAPRKIYAIKEEAVEDLSTYILKLL